MFKQYKSVKKPKKNPQIVPALIVIPAKDEAETIGDIVQRARAQTGFAVLVIDDGSADQTARIARANGAMVLAPCIPLGAWGATQTGIRYALAHGFNTVITVDADGQHEPEQIPLLIAAQREHSSDMVIGACTSRGSASRRIAWAFFRKLTGLAIEDLTSGFRLYGPRAVAILASREATLLDYQDMGVLIMVRKAGLKLTECEIQMPLRKTGKSRIFNSWLAVGRYLTHTTIHCLSRWEIKPGTRQNSQP